MLYIIGRAYEAFKNWAVGNDLNVGAYMMSQRRHIWRYKVGRRTWRHKVDTWRHNTDEQCLNVDVQRPAFNQNNYYYSLAQEINFQISTKTEKG